MILPKKAKDITGNSYGDLTVKKFVGISSGKASAALWLCSCACGREEVFFGTSLRQGNSKRCSLCANKVISKKKTIHGKTNTRTYTSWKSMIGRCENSSNVDYKIYGGRGIKVCERWRSFENFIADMGERPLNTTLDRIDTNGNYEPANCRWAVDEVQSNNKRTSVFIEYEGEKYTMSQFGRLIGLDRRLVRYRLSIGMTPKQISDNLVTVTKQGGFSRVEGALSDGN